MFNKTPRKMTDVIIFSGVFVLVLILLQSFLGRGVIRYANKVKKDFAYKQVKLKESEGLIKTLPDPQKAIEDIEKKVGEFKEMGVSRKQFPRLVQLLGKSTAEHNINVVSIKPREDIKAGNEALPAGVTKAYIKMVITGPYQAVGEYIKVLSELPVSFSIESLSIEARQATMEQEESRRGAEAKMSSEDLFCILLLSTYMVWEI